MGFKSSFVAAAVIAALSYSSVAVAQMKAVVYKSPYCGCCEGYIAELSKRGFEVTRKNVENLGPVKEWMRVPAELESCHTMVVGGYVVEGHVPFAALDRLLAERPDIIGIALAGMPQGSPGMNGAKQGPFEIQAITKSGTELYMVE